MDREIIKQQLKELFPHLKNETLNFLASTGDDINVLITRIIDNNIDPPSFFLNELVRTNYPKANVGHAYNYPEVFTDHCSINMHQDIKGLRMKASALVKEANELTKKAISHPIKEARYHFSIESNNKREIAKEINREAVTIMMRKIVENIGPIDLHGFTVEECLGFMDDLLYFKRFTEIQVITGQKYNSMKIRPAMERWFEKNNFMWWDAGPGISARKKPNFK